ncbi:sensor histidine kinase [Marinoscillum sp.]|uniref:sensor histidine kinase n=1 Tax=Marinoscillum sp. TaxID=2024838 RepID=UPI003BA8BFC7
MKRLLLRIASIRWLQHLIFWVLSLSFITSYFSISNELAVTDLIYSFWFHLCVVPMVYVLLRFIIPILFESERYLLFLFAAGINLLFGWGLHYAVFEWVVPKVMTSYYIVSFTDNFILIVILTVYTLLATLLHFSKSWFKVNSLEKDKINLELNSLKNQLNPHFLFNGLNGIYSLSVQNDKRAPEAILKLSDLLRYSLYEVSAETVALEKEIQILQDYIDLQLIRFKPDREVMFNHKGTGNPVIIPMILLPILENAFKHGNLTKEGSFIKVHLTYSAESIHLECLNSFSPINSDESRSGLGLASIRKLIELYYGKKGDLSISKEGNQFRANLKLLLS